MADNVIANPGAGGATFATDDIGGVHYPLTKIALGALDANEGPVSKSNPMPSQLYADSVAFAPGYGAPTTSAIKRAGIDTGGAVSVRASTLTDEGTFRVNFANTSLAVSIGSVTISGAVVTGTGFSAIDVHLKDYFKLDADGESAWLQIISIDSDTQLTLASSYVGGVSGAASRSLVKPETGSGGSIAVASGQCTLTSGTTSGSKTSISRAIDYAPLIYRGRYSISQRIANQDIYIGLRDPSATAKHFARFKLTSTVNTTIICESGRNPSGAPSASETESTTVTLPNGATTAALNDYRVEMLTESVRFYINGVRVAEHFKVIPSAYDIFASGVFIDNTGVPGSSTSVVSDFVTVKNHNKLEVGIFSDAEQIVASQPDSQLFTFSQAGVIAINTDLLIIDCRKFRSLSIQCTTMGTSGVVTPAWSNDGVTFVADQIMTMASAAAGSFNAAGIWTTKVKAGFFRLRLTTAASAGTTTIYVNGFQVDIGQPVGQPVTATLTNSSTTIGDVGIQYRASSAGAASISKVLSAATTNATVVKASAGRVIGWSIVNTTAAIKYLRLYNKTTAPTVGTDSPVSVIPIPANGIATVSHPGGIGFATGIGYSITGASPDLDATATAVGDVVGSIYYA